MKRLYIILLLLSCSMHLTAQEFIGCRTDSGWAETPMFRKTIVLTEEPQYYYHINLTVISWGYHEVYVNNVKVGDYVMQPAVSQLDKRALSLQYDITKYLHKGENELMLWVGQGWGRVYNRPAAVNAYIRWFNGIQQAGYFDVTDSTWEATPSGYSYTGSWQPLQFGGERYDARVKPDWRPASAVRIVQDSCETPYRKIKLINTENSPQEFKGNHIVDVIEPQSVEMLDDGSTLLDFGRVLTGQFRAIFHPTIHEGQEITMEYLDHLDAKPPFTEKDIFIANGNAYESFTNRFLTHSFRYVRVVGAGPFESHYYAYQVSAVDPNGGATFECSDPRLNAIHDMVKYTLSCLTFNGYMVDCPHLERMGYGGDGNSSTMTLQTIWDVRDTYRNWMKAWGDAMEPDGELPYVAPAYRTGGGPYWSGFIVKAPWRTYINYGEKTDIVWHYGKMKRWLEFIERNSKDYILQPWPDNERHTWFLGDWLAPEGVDIGGESVLHVNSCFISDCLADMEQMARITQNNTDADRFSQWRQQLNASIHRHFYHPETHTYANGTPLDQTYALLMGIPPDSATAAAVKSQLLKDCHGRYRDHIAVGLMGVPIFTEWCIRERETDLMATILRQPDYPGYLYMINNGATTTWESWDCGRPGKEDRSRVHNCYNGIGIWFYQALAGIRPDPQEPGYKHFFIDPQPCEGIYWVKATKPSPYGDIKVEIKDGKMEITVPEGTTATVFPGTTKEQTLAGGEHIIAL